MPIQRSLSSRKAPESEESESDGETETVQDAWEAAEDQVHELLIALKEQLACIDVGVGDRISLAKFVKFIEINSTSLD